MSLLLALGLASLNIFMLLYIRDVKVWYYHIKVLQVCSIHNDYFNKSLLSVCYLWTGRQGVIFVHTGPHAIYSYIILLFVFISVLNYTEIELSLKFMFLQTLHVNI